MAFCAYLIGVLIYPLLADWIWGGGWLAELGRESGSATAWSISAAAPWSTKRRAFSPLVIAVSSGTTPRPVWPQQDLRCHSWPQPALCHFGSIILLISWMAANASPAPVLTRWHVVERGAAAIDTLLAASAGLIASFIQAASQKRRPEPARLCRGLLRRRGS